MGTTLLPVPHPKALALPDIVERATLIAHADMIIVIPRHDSTHLLQREYRPRNANKHIPRTSTVASSLTISFEFARFLDVKDKTFEDAFKYVAISTFTHPLPAMSQRNCLTQLGVDKSFAMNVGHVQIYTLAQDVEIGDKDTNFI